MDNFFYKKFQDKSNSELENLLAHKDSYTSEAILASIKILEERGLPVENFETLKEQTITLQKKEQRKLEASNFQEQKKEDTDLPELYSKRVILAFSILFSTIFGTVLLFMNMKKANQPNGSTLVLVFGISYTLVIAVLSNHFQLSPVFGLLFNFLGATILNEYFWNRFIGKETKFKKRSWAKPALISVVIVSFIAFFAIYNGIPLA
ncbi:hypothetical protein N9V96_00650 [Polaribacter sp.]|nr:hypothetical protein [Polaribacter sp.]